ncbi:MerR family DNA-binding transcriptional regulator [Lacticaseibacillus manihotivorans]|uniref:MerR family DNA-binding transcriptional regulator n=1 Tax=Lacticaseibacillus manihotivorans TaxID=88233 RepID=UPI000B00284E|nr:MerR family DNA-binding transcriptional regulator [Lacticaseibacillus manihotivorans]
MTYSIQQFAKLSGVTPRTLRYYHQLGLVVHKCQPMVIVRILALTRIACKKC